MAWANSLRRPARPSCCQKLAWVPGQPSDLVQLSPPIVGRVRPANWHLAGWAPSYSLNLAGGSGGARVKTFAKQATDICTLWRQ